MSLYLFKELPLHLWTPARAEVGLIRDWLLNFSLTAVENRLACIILEGLNWGFQPVSLSHKYGKICTDLLSNICVQV